MMREHASNESENPIRAARQARGLTLAACSVMADLAISTLWAAERGLVSERTAKRLARVLHVPAEQLLPTTNRGEDDT